MPLPLSQHHNERYRSRNFASHNDTTGHFETSISTLPNETQAHELSVEDQLRPKKVDFLEDQLLRERVDSAEDQPFPRNVDTKEGPRRKSGEPQTGSPKKPAGLTLTMESNPSSSSKELLGVVSTPSPAQSSSSYMTPQEIVSGPVSSPTGSASPTREMPSPSSNVPGLNSVICAPPAPVHIGGTVIYGPEGSGLCLQCWMIHSKGFGGPFVDLEIFDHRQIDLGDNNKELNGQTRRLSASTLVGTVVRVINWLAGSLPRTQ